ncbi:Lrp/AsnC ligand binding domain-containing protein [Rhodospirillum sp. A1_3_36]|uniref:Lrp/AsnC ligand binding domain-containing protein n=1 Tax=Rhodospirillum sp. A1_3_36 TaxID=3391666 RepID=UPI0039A554DE
MQKIFVMIKCELGRAYEVADDIIERIEEVSEVDSISGQYDLMAKFYLKNDADIGHFVTQNVQTITGIKDTFTIMAFKAFR